MTTNSRAMVFALILSLAVFTVSSRPAIGSVSAAVGLSPCIDLSLVAAQNNVIQAMVLVQISDNPQPSDRYNERIRSAHWHLKQAVRSLQGAFKEADIACEDD